MKNSWLNLKLDLSELKTQFQTNKPFEHISILDLFNPNNLEELIKELNKLDYYLEDHDLYQFLRTIDFKHIQNEKVKEFRDFIFSEDFVSIIEKIVGFDLVRNKGDLHSLKLGNTHYLLCHDDQVQDRSIAFILNLSVNWKEEYGGSLDLFSVDSKNEPKEIVKKIIPKFNQFNMFKVSDKSFHQISEVEVEDGSRLSISGWFYKK